MSGVVIVESHMMNDRGNVQLRNIILSNGGIDGAENMILLENLAWTIKDLSCGGNYDRLAHHRDQSGVLAPSHPNNAYHRDGGIGSGNNYCNNKSLSSSIEPSIECIYIQNDQFFDSERHASRVENKAQLKAINKTVRGITQRAEAFVRSMADPSDGASNDLSVFVVTDVSFWCLRDFGSHLMKTADMVQSANKACLETIESYPDHKRSLKTLGAAIESYMKRNGFWKGGPPSAGGANEVIFLLYSKLDDRFDMVTLQC